MNNIDIVYDYNTEELTLKNDSEVLKDIYSTDEIKNNFNKIKLNYNGIVKEYDRIIEQLKDKFFIKIFLFFV